MPVAEHRGVPGARPVLGESPESQQGTEAVPGESPKVQQSRPCPALLLRGPCQAVCGEPWVLAESAEAVPLPGTAPGPGAAG